MEPSYPHSQFIEMQIDDLYLVFRLEQKKYYTYLGMLIDLVMPCDLGEPIQVSLDFDIIFLLGLLNSWIISSL